MKIKISLSVKTAFLVMIISFFAIVGISYFSYSESKKIFIKHSEELLSKNLDKYSFFIKEEINKLKKNALFLSNSPSLQGMMRAYKDHYRYDEKTNQTYSQYKTQVATILKLLLKQNPQYFQTRILNDGGIELIKFIRQDGKIIQVPEKKLQNKSNMKYYKEIIKTKPNQIYISHINLNKEYNKIEFPIKPTIRVASFILKNNKPIGITIINADVAKLFKYKELRSLKDEKTYILNQKGEYLFDYDNPKKEFGFEFGKNYSVFSEMPELKKFFKSTKNVFTYIDHKHGIILKAKKVFLTPDRYIVIVKTTSTSIFKEKAKDYLKRLFIVIIIITILITLFTVILVNILTKPIKHLTHIANNIAKTKGKKEVKINIKTNDEIGELAKSINIMLKRLIQSKKEIENFAEKLEKEVEKKTKELKEINENLQKMVDEKIKEIREKDKVLSHQNKLAAMGEMIGAVAHQWRQPLNSLAINIQMLEDLYDAGELDRKALKEIIEKNMNTIKFMSNTIDDFRNFFRKDKEKTLISLKELIEKTISLQSAQLKNHNIQIKTDIEDIMIKVYKNEFMQVILNLISNAKDAIEEKRKENYFEGIIQIKAKKDKNNIVISIKDNGQGISKNTMERIFEPYFTTKEEGKGTGMGLYMVKEIIERMGGEISVRNTDEGAEFIIILKDDNETE